MHKAGFVNIVGNPNVGKSTLMNVLVGERISIATFKAQTTRHRIMGIYNTDEMQIVFSDTPGPWGFCFPATTITTSTCSWKTATKTCVCSRNVRVTCSPFPATPAETR